jgi:ABC-2 type transport system ATP-binding protein
MTEPASGVLSGILVETHALTKRYGAVTALDDCHLRVGRAEVFGLLGPNGSGKTTLLRLLMGFLRPSSGRAAIDGWDCYRHSVEVHRRTAYLPGDVRLFGQMRGADVLRFFRGIRGAKRGAGARDADEQVARRLKLELSRPVSEMSTGMRQKAALAAVMSIDAPLIILDEPTANLDPNMRQEVLALVREAKSAGRSFVFSSHVLDEVEQVCDRVGILRAGRLAHVQVIADLRRQHLIRARLTAAMPPMPPALAAEIALSAAADEVTIRTAGELAPLLGWLATLPLAEVRIEPIGLRTVYDRYHGSVVPGDGNVLAG